MAYLTPQDIFNQLLIEREMAIRREHAVYRGEVEDDGEFERLTRPEPVSRHIAEKAERVGPFRI